MCSPGFAVTATAKELLLMIGPYSTPSSQTIIPSIVAPETEGLELAVTVNAEPTVAPLAGEVTVITSSEFWVSCVKAAGALHKVKTAKKILVFAATREYGKTRC